jgi:hypothetical protein
MSELLEEGQAQPEWAPTAAELHLLAKRGYLGEYLESLAERFDRSDLVLDTLWVWVDREKGEKERGETSPKPDLAKLRQIGDAADAWCERWYRERAAAGDRYCQERLAALGR